MRASAHFAPPHRNFAPAWPPPDGWSSDQQAIWNEIVGLIPVGAAAHAHRILVEIACWAHRAGAGGSRKAQRRHGRADSRLLQRTGNDARGPRSARGGETSVPVRRNFAKLSLVNRTSARRMRKLRSNLLKCASRRSAAEKGVSSGTNHCCSVQNQLHATGVENDLAWRGRR
jgi:hypothetical protein